MKKEEEKLSTPVIGGMSKVGSTTLNSSSFMARKKANMISA